MLTLEELSKQPVNQRQAIIIVNKATVLPEYESNIRVWFDSLKGEI